MTKHMRVLVARCAICGNGFELPLVFDPQTLRTDFDISEMTAHLAAHQAADRLRKRQ